MNPLTILVIDDEPDICYFTKSCLVQLGGCRVATATTAAEGLKAAKDLRPDLILLDILMPGMNGMELLKRLKEEPATVGIPVIMLTAVDNPESKQMAQQLYCDDYVEKPVEITRLQARIQDVLGRLGKRVPAWSTRPPLAESSA